MKLFYGACLKTFECLKERLIPASIIVCLDWFVPFEVICNVNFMSLVIDLDLICEKYFISFTVLAKHSTPHKKMTQLSDKNYLWWYALLKIFILQY